MTPTPEVLGAAKAVAAAVDELHLSREERAELRLRTVASVLGHCVELIRCQVDLVISPAGGGEQAGRVLDDIAELHRAGVDAIDAAIAEGGRGRRSRRRRGRLRPSPREDELEPAE